MRILSIRFKNLNSLAGEWEIDLQHPAFTSSGIFAITGPTGSGKTTILDAICLALYGQTPRLVSISGSTNEIMTRHTGECYAEVTFESSHGAFRCHWYQNRAGKRSDGRLQPPEHEIVDGVTGVVITKKIRDVAAKVREVTGMDFDQFTRSMLLAQGGFAAFLEAKPDDRAPILEQITGTGIYSDISKRVHDRTSQEREQLRILQERAGAIELLSPEDKERLILEKAEKETVVAALLIQVRSLQDRLDLLARISGLQQEIQVLKNQQEDLSIRRNAATPDLLRLERGKKAAVYEAGWRVLTGLRDREKLDEHTLSDLQIQAAAASEDRDTARTTLGNAEQDLRHVQQEYDVQRQVLIRVRDLDTRIEGARKEIIRDLQTIKEKEKRHVEIQDTILSLQTEYQNYCTKHADACSYLTEHHDDFLLIEAYTGISSKLAAWDESYRSLTSITNNLQKASDDLTASRLVYEQKKEAVISCEQGQGTLTQELRVLHEQVTALLDGSAIAEIRMRESELKDRNELLKKLQEMVTGETALLDSLSQLVADASVLNMSLKEQSGKRSDTILHRIRQEELITVLDKSVRLAVMVRDLTGHRDHLIPGDPCPLCGSVVHPYATGDVPAPDEDEENLIAARALLADITAAISAFDVSLATISRDISRNQEEQIRITDQIAAARDTWIHGAEDLGIPPDTENRDEVLLDAIRDTEERIAHESFRIKRYEELDLKIRNMEQRVTTGKDHLASLQKEENDASILCSSGEQHIRQLQTAREEVEFSLATQYADLEEALAPFHVPTLTPESKTDIDSSLKICRDRYREHDRIRRDLEPKIADLSGKIEGMQVNLSDLEGAILQGKTGKENRERDLSTILTERVNLFGDKNPQAEEEKVRETVRISGEAVDTARKTLDEKTRAVDLLSGQITSLITSLQGMRSEIGAKSNLFLQVIAESGFSDEALFLDTLLPADELASLEALASGFDREEQSITTLLGEKQKLLAEAEISVNTGIVSGDPAAAHAEATKTLETTQQDLVRISLRLEEDAARREQVSGNLAHIETRKRELVTWERLHSLIGSADGKKFRVFAQGLTFQILIAQANHHLQVMTDRYLLQPDPLLPLDLAVIDTWQAGDVRSTRNLSGGERFIVSLALALGLAGMVSKHVRVDSLFLDEGFGTLDDDSLDAALGALSGLQQQGKLIGIISHVPAIKERISTRILVEKRSHGRSVIVAPGCRKVS